MLILVLLYSIGSFLDFFPSYSFLFILSLSYSLSYFRLLRYYSGAGGIPFPSHSLSPSAGGKSRLPPARGPPCQLDGQRRFRLPSFGQLQWQRWVGCKTHSGRGPQRRRSGSPIGCWASSLKRARLMWSKARTPFLIRGGPLILRRKRHQTIRKRGRKRPHPARKLSLIH